MKRIAYVMIIAAFLAAGCDRMSGRSGEGVTRTETIKPANAQPAPPTGTEALTGTTEVEDSRSEGEGGSSTVETKSTTSTTSKAPAKAPKKTKK